MVQQNRPAVGLRRLWSHGYFESRLEDEAARTATTGTSFALARVHLTEGAPWTRVVPVLVRTIPLPHLFAAYGPRDYEILFVESTPDDVMKLMEALAGALPKIGNRGPPRCGLVPARRQIGRRAPGARECVGQTPDRRGQAPNGWRAVRPGSTERPGHGTHFGTGETGGVEEYQRVDPGRNRCRQGRAGPDHSPTVGATGRFRGAQLRRPDRDTDRERVVRSREGSIQWGRRRPGGVLEAAKGGTVFLDEIGDMPTPLQAALLRAIETREILPVGAIKPRSIDVRFLAATNRDLEQAVVDGAFRQDLFFPHERHQPADPPLRARTNEIPTLVDTFIKESCAESGRGTPPTFTPDAMDYLLGYAWPGNIRELKNLIERALVLCDGPDISADFLPLDKMRTLSGEFVANGLAPVAKRPPKTGGGGAVSGTGSDGERLPWLGDPDKVAERQRIVDALDANAWNQTRAAQSLGMPRRTFVSKLEYYRIPRPQKNGGTEAT